MWAADVVTFAPTAGDDLPDLFVVNYLDWTPAGNRTCYHAGSAEDYCSPDAYRATPDRFYRNTGRGPDGLPRFVDATDSAGFAVADGPGLGVVAADLSGDGQPDLYVANDAQDNQYWVAGDDGRFTDEAALAGLAVNGDGQREASMGIAVGDPDGDLDLDLFLTHLGGETNTFYENRGGFFRDATRSLGLAAPSLPFTGFGAGFIDVENDGRLDLLAVNGAVQLHGSRQGTDGGPGLAERNQWFRRDADGRYTEIHGGAGDPLGLVETSRGAAFGDVDNDGDTDVLVCQTDGPARLLVNRAGQAAEWVGLDVRDEHGHTATGATVISDPDGTARRWRVATDGSYASASDPRLRIGRGSDTSSMDVEVRWPDGARERFDDLAPGREHRLVRGTGRPP